MPETEAPTAPPAPESTPAPESSGTTTIVQPRHITTEAGRGADSPLAKSLSSIMEGKPAAEKPSGERVRGDDGKFVKPDATPKPAVEKKEVAEEKPKVVESPDEPIKRGKVVEATTKPPVQAKEEDPLSEADKRQLSATTQARIRELSGKFRAEEARAKKATEELAAAQKALDEAKATKPDLPDDVKSQLEQLKQYRRRFDLEKDPEIVTQFDSKIDATEQQINAMLKRHGLPDTLEKTIKEHGGFLAFSRSSLSVPVPNQDGVVEQVPAAKLYERILGLLPAPEADLIRAAIGDQARLKRDRDLKIKEESGKAAEFFTKQEQEQAEQTKQQQAHQETFQKTLRSARDKAFTEIPWMKDVDVPEGDGEAAKQARAINKKHAQYRKLYDETLATKDVNDVVLTMLDSVEKYHLQDQLKETEAKLKAAQDELDQIKEASRTVPRNGSGREVASETAEDTSSDPRKTTLRGALEAMQNRA